VNSTSDALSFSRAQPAGFFLRAIAFVVDLAVVTSITWVLGIALIRTPNPSDVQDNMVLLFLVLGAIYSVGFSWKWGGTLGKLLFRMRVVRMRDGGPVNWFQASVRWASYLFSASIFGAGFLMAAFHPLKRTLHDLVASTRVVRISGQPGK
jgi:uncharacterized RDD family membrane protein YckC